MKLQSEHPIIQEIRRVAGENPERVYGGMICKYVVGSQPSCLVGHALMNLGLIDASIVSTDKNESGFRAFEDEKWFKKLSDDEIYWICSAQAEQDAETPWGVAVKAADEAVCAL